MEILLQSRSFYLSSIGPPSPIKILSDKVSSCPQASHPLHLHGNSGWSRGSPGSFTSHRRRESCASNPGTLWEICASDPRTWWETSRASNCLRHLTNSKHKDLWAAHCGKHKDLRTPCKDFWTPLGVKHKDTKSREASEQDPGGRQKGS